jgi:hypothetical protein
VIDHKLRVILIAALFAVALIAVVVLVALGQDEGTGFGAVLGVLGTLGPALLDAQSEQKKRRATVPPPAA